MNDAWSWLQQNAQLISSLSMLIMAVVWVVYLHVFYLEQRRRHRPCLEIQHARQVDLDAPCLLANMSTEAVFVVCAMGVVSRNGEVSTYQLSIRQEADAERNTPYKTRQGTLVAGQLLNLGSMREILGNASGKALQDVQWAEVRVVALHGTLGRFFGARRRYRLHSQDDGVVLMPETLATQQLRGWRHGPKTRRWARQCMEMAVPSETDEA